MVDLEPIVVQSIEQERACGNVQLKFKTSILHSKRVASR